MKKCLAVIIMVCLTGAVPTLTESKSLVVELKSPGVEGAHIAADPMATGEGTSFTLELDLPPELLGKRIDRTVLECVVDVLPGGDFPAIQSAMIEVYPTSARAGLETDGGGVAPITARNVNFGEKKRVLLDITEFVRIWASGRSEDAGVIVRSSPMTKTGGLKMRPDGFTDGVVAKLRIQYSGNTAGELPPEKGDDPPRPRRD